MPSPPPEVKRLASGATLALHADRGHPMAVVRCYVRGGSIAEWPSGGSGAAHLLEHVIATRAARRMGDRGLGALLDAHTARDHTCFTVEASPADCVDALDALLEAMGEGSGSPGELEPQRGVVLEELRLASERSVGRLRRAFAHRLFERHPIRQPVAGWPERVRRLSGRDLDELWERAYRASSLCVAAAGHLEPEAIERVVDRRQRDLPAGSPFGLPAEAMETGPPRGGAFEIADRDLATDVEHTQVGFATGGAGLGAVELELLAAAFASQPGVAPDEELAAACAGAEAAASHVATAYGAGMFSVLVRHRPGAGDRVREALSGWLTRLAAGREPLELAMGELCFASLSLAEQTAILGESDLLLGAPRAFESLAGRVVRAPEIAALLRRLAEPGRIVAGTLRLARAGSGLERGAGPRAPAAGKEEPGSRAGAAPVPRRGRSVPERAPETAAVPAREPAVLSLPNGIRLLALPGAGSRTSCVLLGRGGCDADARDGGGCCNLTVRLVARGVEGVDPFCDPSFFGWSAAAERGAVEPTIDRLVRCLALEPDEDAFEELRLQVVAQLERGPAAWEERALGALQRALYPGHPWGWGRLGTLDSVRALRPGDLRRCHDRLVVGRNLVGVIAGPDATRSTLSRLAVSLESLPAGEAPASSPPAPAPSEPRCRLVGGETSTHWLASGFSGVAWEAESAVALDVLKTLLVGPQGAEANGLLVDRLRSLGLGYSLHCVSQPGFTEGFFGFLVRFSRRCDAARIRGAVEDELEALRARPVAPSLLRRAVGLQLLHHRRLYSRPDREAYLAARHIQLSGSVDDWERLAARLEDLGAAAVSEAVARYLTESRRVTVATAAEATFETLPSLAGAYPSAGRSHRASPR